MNKLRENFLNELAEIAIENNLSEKCELISKKCEQITDDFSVKFAEWYLDNYHMNNTTTELLQIFKEKYYS